MTHRAACLLALCTLLLGLASCTARKPGLAYQLRGAVVHPPEAAAPGLAAILKAARKPRKGGCNVPGDSISLEWKRRTAVVRAQDLGVDQAGRMPLVLLKAVDEFREALTRLESNGCLARGDARGVLTGLSQRMALPSALAYEMVHASSSFQGYVDADPPFRLKVVAAIRRDGAIAGFETTRYTAQAGTLRPIGTELSVEGKVEPRAGPSVTGISAPAGTKYLRLFFLTRRSAADHDALLIAAADSARLTAATAAIASQGQAFCANPQGVTCIDTPGEAAVSVELPVRANGRLVGVPVRGTVFDAIRESGTREPASVIATLSVTRPYAGRPIPVQFDPSKRDILGLVLIGGEELSWR